MMGPGRLDTQLEAEFPFAPRGFCLFYYFFSPSSESTGKSSAHLSFHWLQRWDCKHHSISFFFSPAEKYSLLLSFPFLFLFGNYKTNQDFFLEDSVEVSPSTLLSLQAIISKRPCQMGSHWKLHHWPCQLGLRASHTVNTITRQSNAGSLCSGQIYALLWQHGEVQTSMRAHVWAQTWSSAINLLYKLNQNKSEINHD